MLLIAASEYLAARCDCAFAWEGWDMASIAASYSMLSEDTGVAGYIS